MTLLATVVYMLALATILVLIFTGDLKGLGIAVTIIGWFGGLTFGYLTRRTVRT